MVKNYNVKYQELYSILSKFNIYFHQQSIMRLAKSYIRDTSDFLKGFKELGSVPQNALFVTAYVVELYPSIPHQDGLEALSIELD